MNNNNLNNSENNNKNLSNIYLEKSREIQRIKSLFEFTDINENDAINKSISLNMSKLSNKANFNSNNNLGMISFSSKNSFNFKKIENNNNNNNNDLAINNLIQLIHNNYNDIVEYENNSNFQKNFLLKDLNKKTFYKFVKSKENLKDNDKNENNNNKIIKKINFNKFNSLTSSSFYNLFNFIYYDYDKLINLNNFISNKLNLTLTNLFIDTINKFKEKYKDQLELTEYYFKYNQFKKGKFIFPLFDLIIKAKILINNPGNSVTFSYIYKVKNNYKNNYKDSNNDNNEFIHTIKFDLFKKNFCNIWLCSEFEEYKGNLKRISYLQPILPYSKDDSIQFHINIFNVNSTLIPFSVIFTDLKIEKIKSDLKYFYENTFMLDKIKISNFRFNEVEFSINIWKNLNNLTDKNFINNVLKIYENNFEIEDVRYEIVKYYVFKIKLKAIKTGIISRNKYIGYNIEIIEKDENYINEEQGIGILNSGYNNNDKILKIRKGNILIFYINEVYKITNNITNNINNNINNNIKNIEENDNNINNNIKNIEENDNNINNNINNNII